MVHEYQVIENSYYRGLNLFLSRIHYRAPHFHRECEIILVLEGSCDLIFSNGTSTHMAESDVTVIGPMEIHEIRSNEQGALLITIQSSFTMIEYFLSRRIDPYITGEVDLNEKMSDETRKTLRELCVSLAFSYPGMPEENSGDCFALQAQLINHLLKLFPENESRSGKNRMMQKRGLMISKIVEHIDENFQQKLTLSDIAEAQNLSLSYLSHAFKDAMGLSFQEYLTHKRFENACRLLQTSDMNMLDISISSGFSDVRYMMKAFSEIAGCSPTEYKSHFKEYSEENSRVAAIQQYYLSREEARSKLIEYRQKHNAGIKFNS